jgi:3-oxoacyl-[acyl-carrier-protein] synthase II
MSKQVFVTGLGIVTGIGISVQDTLESLLAGKSGVGIIKYLQTNHKEIPCSEVQLSETQMRTMLSIPGNGSWLLKVH